VSSLQSPTGARKRNNKKINEMKTKLTKVDGLRHQRSEYLCIWKHVIGTTVGLEPLEFSVGVEPTAEAQFKINLKATWMFT
jgi:hypothetical protein